MIYGRAAPFPRIYQAFTGVSVPASWFCTPDHSLLPPGLAPVPERKHGRVILLINLLLMERRMQINAVMEGKQLQKRERGGMLRANDTSLAHAFVTLDSLIFKGDLLFPDA